MLGLAGNLSDLTVTSSRYDILLCSDTLVSDMRNVSQLLVPGFGCLLDDLIFDCLLASMAAVQAEDVRASFLSVGDLNGHHQEWLGSTTTNRHGVATFDFATVSGCDQLVVGKTHARGGALDQRIVTVTIR